MREFFEGEAVVIKYNGKHGVVIRASATTVVVQVGDKVMYLKPQDVRAQ